MIGEPVPDQPQHVLRDVVGAETFGLRHEQVGLCGLAVVRIEIPFPALGRIAVHQQAGLAPHLAIEILHAQLLAPVGPAFELGPRAHKTVVVQNVYRQAEAAGPSFHVVPDTPFPGFRHHNAFGIVAADGPFHLTGKRARVARVINPHVVHRPPLAAQTRREVGAWRKTGRRSSSCGV